MQSKQCVSETIIYNNFFPALYFSVAKCKITSKIFNEACFMISFRPHNKNLLYTWFTALFYNLKKRNTWKITVIAINICHPFSFFRYFLWYIAQINFCGWGILWCFVQLSETNESSRLHKRYNIVPVYKTDLVSDFAILFLVILFQLIGNYILSGTIKIIT